MMKEVIRQIFTEHGYTTQDSDDSYLAMIENKEYFFVSEYTEEEIKTFFDTPKTESLIEFYNLLKIDYPDLKKNASLIICHKSSDLGAFKEENKNMIFRIEEDEYYFRKYIIIYSEGCLEAFSTEDTVLNKINEILQDPSRLEVYQQDYYENDVYFVAMQLIVKLPFLNFNPLKTNFSTMAQELSKAISEKELNEFNEQYRVFDSRLTGESAEDYFTKLEASVLSTESDDESIVSLFNNFEGVTK